MNAKTVATSSPGGMRDDFGSTDRDWGADLSQQSDVCGTFQSNHYSGRQATAKGVLNISLRLRGGSDEEAGAGLAAGFTRLRR